MRQRNSGYARQRDEAYDSPPWVARALAPFLQQRGATHLWEPAIGAGNLAHTLRAEGFQITGASDDFLAKSATPLGVDAICTNPPFGFGGRLACKFIKHALELRPIVAMLLRIDFDSGRSRVHLFRDHPDFAQKIVLLHRIVWFEREASEPSENHACFVWDAQHRGPPTIAYAGNDTAPFQSSMTMLNEILRGYSDAQSRILSAGSG
jgi:hypothetical protein